MERALGCLTDWAGILFPGMSIASPLSVSENLSADYTLFTFSLPKELSRYIIEKGSVAIDGISLTVNSCSPGEFSVSIIPHTLKMTTLGSLQVGGHGEY